MDKDHDIDVLTDNECSKIFSPKFKFIYQLYRKQIMIFVGLSISYLFLIYVYTILFSVVSKCR